MNGRAAVRWLLTSRQGGVLIASVVAGVSSAVVTYQVTNKRLEAIYDAQANRDVEEARQFYMSLVPDEVTVGDAGEVTFDGGEIDAEVVADVEAEVKAQKSMVEQAVTLMKNQGYIPYDQVSTPNSTPAEEDAVVEVTASITKNIWNERQAELGIDVADVQKKKSQGRPYNVTEEEFMENELEWTQRHLTWFEGDETLADETDEMIRDVDTLLDFSNLKFGVGTKDSNAVYIANASTQTIYEITRSSGSYSIEVMGGDMDLIDTPTLRKFRPDL